MAPPSRQEALSTLSECHERLSELLGSLSEGDLVKPATIGGGDWSAKDLMGHIAAWEELALASLNEWRNGDMPWVERPNGPMSGSDQVDAFNARSVQEKRLVDLDEIRRGFEASYQNITAAIEATSDDEWLSTASYPISSDRVRTLADLLGALTAGPERRFGHAFAHLPDLEAYVGAVSAG